MSQEALENVALRYEAVAAELKTAIIHLEDVATHLRTKEFPRAGAHAFSAYGHMEKADKLFIKLAKLHADKSTPQPREGDTN